MIRNYLWIAVAIAATGCSTRGERVQMEQKQLTVAAYASGILVPEQEYKVVSGVDGYLSQSLVKEGDTVVRGQLMFTLTSEVRDAQQRGALAIVRDTKPVVANDAPAFRELRGQMEVARIKATQDSLQYIRYKTLFDQNAISRSNYERYFLQYQSSLKDYQNLKQRLEQQSLNSALQMQQARNQLSLAEAQTAYGRLRSFVDGTVYDIYKKPGDLVSPNQPVALIGAGKMFAKLMVDEDDLNKIFPGQKVLISMDAWPDKIFQAHISKVYPLLSKVEQSFRVDAVFDDPLPGEMYGLNLEANIVVAENKMVNVLPRAAVMKGDSLWIEKEGKKQKVKVQTGIEDEQYVEITGGITKETTVIVAP